MTSHFRHLSQAQLEHAIAPNGRSFAENFKAWFRESKVVDSNRRPLVVYHGTRSDFDAFCLERAGSNFGSQSSFLGFYFTPVQWIAQSIADNSDLPGRPRVLEVHLSLQNPAVIDMKRGAGNVVHLLQRAKEAGHDGAIICNWNDGIAPLEDLDGNPEPIPPQFVAFRPSQIKSATTNSGLFDSASDLLDDRDHVIDRKPAHRRVRPR